MVLFNIPNIGLEGVIVLICFLFLIGIFPLVVFSYMGKFKIVMNVIIIIFLVLTLFPTGFLLYTVL